MASTPPCMSTTCTPLTPTWPKTTSGPRSTSASGPATSGELDVGLAIVVLLVLGVGELGAQTAAREPGGDLEPALAGADAVLLVGDAQPAVDAVGGLVEDARAHAHEWPLPVGQGGGLDARAQRQPAGQARLAGGAHIEVLARGVVAGGDLQRAHRVRAALAWRHHDRSPFLLLARHATRTLAAR